MKKVIEQAEQTGENVAKNETVAIVRTKQADDNYIKPVPADVLKIIVGLFSRHEQFCQLARVSLLGPCMLYYFTGVQPKIMGHC